MYIYFTKKGTIRLKSVSIIEGILDKIIKIMYIDKNKNEK